MGFSLQGGDSLHSTVIGWSGAWSSYIIYDEELMMGFVWTLR